MMSQTNVIAAILIMAAVTFVTRMIPFALFSRRQPSKSVLYIGKYAPAVMLTILVVYCFKDVSPLVFPHGLPELAAAALVVLLHLWRGNALLSITLGTVAYMAMVQLIPGL